MFIIVLFQPVLLTVIGVILIAVRLPLDDSASDLSMIAPPLQTNCQENEEEKEREKERGSRREIGLLSVLEQALLLSGVRLAKGKL